MVFVVGIVLLKVMFFFVVIVFLRDIVDLVTMVLVSGHGIV